MNNQEIRYSHSDHALLDKIKLFWEELNEDHCQHSPNLDHCNQLTLEKRKSDLLNKSLSRQMRVDLAVDEASGCTVGYCLSSHNSEKIGEIESIFANMAYRGLGIANSQIKKTRYYGRIREDAEAKIVEVGDDNVEAFGFYGRYGSWLEKRC